LILGEPGAGKTITLLQLASELLARAETSPGAAIPVVLNLSSWNEQSEPLEKWLHEELRGKYFVPGAVAEDWIAKDALTLLLDGLDEVLPEKRTACIETINAYRQNHGPTQMAICCRKADYADQPQRLQLDNAIALQPLDEKQVKQILASDERGMIVAETLQGDASLSQLARTPLMLNIMMTASQDVSDADWRRLGNVEAHRRRLFDLYLKNVFRRRRPSASEAEETTARVLPWLARHLSEQGQTMFLMEGLGPEWLKPGPQRSIAFLSIRLLPLLLLAFFVYLFYLAGGEGPLGLRMALALGACAFLTSLISARLNNPLTLLLNTALTSFACGLLLETEWPKAILAGFVLGIPGGAIAIALQTPRMTDRLRWSWGRTLSLVLGAILVEGSVSAIVYFSFGIEPFFTFTSMLLLALPPVALGGMLIFGWRPSMQVAKTVVPNQGFWQSLRNAVGISLFLLLILLPLSLPIAWSMAPNGTKLSWELLPYLQSAIPFVFAAVGLMTLPLGLWVGGAACLQQLIIRFILSSTKQLPWNLIQTLDQATDRIILQRVGGGYIFQHRLLQEHFASPTFKQIHPEKEQP
jgi:DNA polymerase III delta prime subunit